MTNKTDPSSTQSPAGSLAANPAAKRRSKKRRRGKSHSRVRVKRNGAISLDGYTPEQRHVINLLSLGSSVESAMQSVNKSRSCFYKWAKNDSIYGAIAQHARAVHRAAIDDNVHEAGADARRLIHRIIVDDNVSPATRLRAALACLNRKSGSWLPHELPSYGHEPVCIEDGLHCFPVNPVPVADGPDPAAELAYKTLNESTESVEFENESLAALNSIETQPLLAKITPKNVHTKCAGSVEFWVSDARSADSDDSGRNKAEDGASHHSERWQQHITLEVIGHPRTEVNNGIARSVESTESVEFRNGAPATFNHLHNQPLTATIPAKNVNTKNAECVEFRCPEEFTTSLENAYRKCAAAYVLPQAERRSFCRSAGTPGG